MFPKCVTSLAYCLTWHWTVHLSVFGPPFSIQVRPMLIFALYLSTVILKRCVEHRRPFITSVTTKINAKFQFKFLQFFHLGLWTYIWIYGTYIFCEYLECIVFWGGAPAPTIKLGNGWQYIMRLPWVLYVFIISILQSISSGGNKTKTSHGYPVTCHNKRNAFSHFLLFLTIKIK
jgi:hypothetical protein